MLHHRVAGDVAGCGRYRCSWSVTASAPMAVTLPRVQLHRHAAFPRSPALDRVLFQGVLIVQSETLGGGGHEVTVQPAPDQKLRQHAAPC